MSVTPSDDTHLAGEERRRARDGNAYTLKEFKEFYGDCRGADYWNSADIHRAGDGSAGSTVEQAGIGTECETATAAATAAAKAVAATAPAQYRDDHTLYVYDRTTFTNPYIPDDADK